MSRFNGHYHLCGQLEMEHNLISPSSTTTFSQLSSAQTPQTPPPLAPQNHQRNFRASKIVITTLCTLLITFTIVTVIKYHNFIKPVKEYYGIIGDKLALESFRESIIVDTECGQIIGDEEYGSYVFKGIPYALPPVGSRRWSSPIAIWNDTFHCNNNRQRNAVKFGSQCFQVNPYDGQYEGSEDCLYLNIWSPEIENTTKLPVMILIHGGFLQFGSGHHPGLRPSGRLSSSMRTVFVSVNYRLHVFGFLAMDNVFSDAQNVSTNHRESSPNYGLYDLIVALEWVQRNVPSFGGDPNRVTLFGADGGGALILALMTSPQSKGLFHSAWLIDPAVFFNRTVEDASRHNAKNFIKRSLCENVACLRSLSPQKVLEYFLGKNDPSFRINDQNDLPILGIMSEQLMSIDESSVFDSFPFITSLVNDIPLLIGTSLDAIDFWPGPRDLMSWSWRDYRKYVTTSLDSFGPQMSEKALELYPPIDSNETTPASQYITMVSDLRQLCPINYLSESLAQTMSSKVFRYLVTSKPSKSMKIYDTFSNRSFHLWEMIAFFDTIETFIRDASEDDKIFSKTIQSMVRSFLDVTVHRRNSSFYWHSMPAQIAVINNSIVGNDYRRNERCNFWQNQTFLNYAWTV